LGQLADHLRAGGVGQARQLAEVLVERLARTRPLERRADEERALDWRRDGDQIA
jgi:hypothetical protein